VDYDVRGGMVVGVAGIDVVVGQRAAGNAAWKKKGRGMNMGEEWIGMDYARGLSETTITSFLT
jgi:hypothetical protein